MRISVKGISAAVVLWLSMASFPALSEGFGMLNGRTADVSRLPDTSVEAGAVFGDLFDVDYEHFGARFNYRVNPTTMAYGDLGQSDLNSRADGIAFGLGAFFQMDGILSENDFAVHASLHRAKLEASGFADETVTVIAVEGLFSGREPIGANENMFWNANVGLTRASSDGNSDTELTFGGGVVVRTASNSGEIFVGVLYIEDLAFGGGYRHFLD